MSVNIQTAAGLLEIGGKVTKFNVFTFTVQQNKYNMREANDSQ